MAQAGARVALVGRDEARLEAVAERCGEGAHDAEADITDDSAATAVVESTVHSLGRLDVIVHSAGVFWPKPFPRLAGRGARWAVGDQRPRAVRDHARRLRAPRGRLLGDLHLVDRRPPGFPRTAAYCATKGAVELLVRSLATELAPRGVRVNAIAPGNIHSPMNAEFVRSPEYEQSMIDLTPAGRVGVVEDVAPAAVFLASDAGRYIHGISLLVDGGWSA